MSELELETEFTAEQIAEAARVIEESYDPKTGRHPLDIFLAICRTTVRPVVELVIFDLNKEKILLTQRPDDDPHFSGMWHLPGVIVLPTDVQGRYADAFDNAALRVIDELEGTRVTSLLPLTPKWLYEGVQISRRGGGESRFYGGLLKDEEPAVGEMFYIGNLPSPLVEEHNARFIAAAREAMYVAPGIDLSIIS